MFLEHVHFDCPKCASAYVLTLVAAVASDTREDKEFSCPICGLTQLLPAFVAAYKREDAWIVRELAAAA